MKAELGRNRTASPFHHLRIASVRSHPPTRNIANVIPKMYQSISDTGGNRNSAEVSDMQHAPKHRTGLSRRILLCHCCRRTKLRSLFGHLGLVTRRPNRLAFAPAKSAVHREHCLAVAARERRENLQFHLNDNEPRGVLRRFVCSILA